MLNRSVVSPLSFRRVTWSARLSLALLLLTGCATMNLNKITITSIAVSSPKGPGIAPGEKLPLVVSMTEPNGKILSTQGDNEDGQISWDDLNIAATVVRADKKGKITLPADPRLSDGKLPHVIVTAPSHPDLRADLDIPVRYDRRFSASFSGQSGRNGLDGMSGTDGMSGSMGSLDPNHPSPGGNGSDGTNGTDGGNGEDGGAGPPVQVRVTLRSSDHPLLQVSVSAQGRESFFLVDPQGGTLTVVSNGGSGGSGGQGGRAGRGGSGGVGTPNGSSGRDGSNGQDGLRGRSGAGGSISVTYDPQSQPFLSAIHLVNPGGPRPVFIEQPVAALW